MYIKVKPPAPEKVGSGIEIVKEKYVYQGYIPRSPTPISSIHNSLGTIPNII
jgi:hypothetical protein